MRLREIKPGMVICCKTKQEAKILLAHLQNQGVTWSNGDSLGGENNWMYFTCDTCYKLENDGLVFCEKNYYQKKNIDITEFSDLIIPELSPAEVLAILYEICKEYSKNREDCSPDCPFAYHGMECEQYKAENGQRVVEICEQWKADHEKKEPEVEWVFDCFQNSNINSAIPAIVVEEEEEAKKHCENMAKKYPGETFAYISVCRVKK